jgi:hypothetical protein
MNDGYIDNAVCNCCRGDNRLVKGPTKYERCGKTVTFDSPGHYICKKCGATMLPYEVLLIVKKKLEEV